MNNLNKLVFLILNIVICLLNKNKKKNHNKAFIKIFHMEHNNKLKALKKIL